MEEDGNMASKAVLKLNNGIGDNLMVFLVDTIAEIDDVSTTVAIGSSIINIGEI